MEGDRADPSFLLPTACGLCKLIVCKCVCVCVCVLCVCVYVL